LNFGDVNAETDAPGSGEGEGEEVDEDDDDPTRGAVVGVYGASGVERAYYEYA
jgi:hypothetical protein